MEYLDFKVQHPDKLIAIPVEEYEHLKECKKRLEEIIELKIKELQNAQHLSNQMNACCQQVNYIKDQMNNL